VARAVCVQTGKLTSHWRLYRIVEAELITQDLTYSLIGMDASEAPRFVDDWRGTDHSKIVPKFDESKLEIKETPKTKTQSDLPDSMEGYKEDKPKTVTTMLIEKTFDVDKLKRDFEVVKGSIFASPWTTQRGGNNSIESIRYGGTITNEGSKYKMDLGFDRTSLQAKNKTTSDEIINESTMANARFSVKNFSQDLDVYTDLTFRQSLFGKILAPQSLYLFAPIGLTSHFAEGKTIKKSLFGYAPTYETRTHERLTTNGYETERIRGVRHAFRFYMEMAVNPNLTLTSDLFYRPRQDSTSWKLDVSDNMSELRAGANVKLMDEFYLVYEYHWLDDAQLRRLSGLPRVVTTNSLNFKYTFGL
jgi:hypothetical protein